MLLKTNRPQNLLSLIGEDSQLARRGAAINWAGHGAERKQGAAELQSRASAIAGALQEFGAEGSPVLLVYPPGLDFIEAFFGSLQARAIAVPTPAPRSRRDTSRIAGILQDSAAEVVLTTAQLEPAVRRLMHDRSVAVLATDTLAAGPVWQPAERDAVDLAYLQYTSGSTSEPRGVMVTHANVFDNLAFMSRRGRFEADSVSVSWLPHYHDMGLVYGILQPIYEGICSHLLDPQNFAQDPAVWLRTIAKTRATHSGGPNFSYDLCVRRIAAPDMQDLDLRSWRVAFNGAEPVNPETMDRFARTFAPNGFRKSAFCPVYGLAEATLMVTAGALEQEPVPASVDAESLRRGAFAPVDDAADRQLLTSCGSPGDGTQIAIVDPDTRQSQQDGRIGEIWLSGPSVTQGYWGRQLETAETFEAQLATGEGPFLRTGDLGCLWNGELFITGRKKDCLIFHGQNYYPQDVERTVEERLPPGHGMAAALRSDGIEGDELTVVVEVGRRLNAEPAKLAAKIRSAVASSHELPLHRLLFVRTGVLPRTSSGKIQRFACRQLIGDPGFEALFESRLQDTGFSAESLVGPDRLLELVARCGRMPADCIDPGLPLVAMGFDSLSTVELSHRLEAEFGLAFPATQLGQTSLDELRAAASSGSRASIRPTSGPAPHSYPLSAAQSAMWLEAKRSPLANAYVISRALRIRGELDPAALRQAFALASASHAALRTRFSPDGDVQTIGETPGEFFRLTDLRSCTTEQAQDWMEAEASRPVDLQSGPIFYVSLGQMSGGEWILIFSVHHLVADFWSLSLLFHEVTQSLAGDSPVYSESLSFGEHVLSAHQIADRPQVERDWEYWKSEFPTAPPSLQLGSGAGIADAGRLTFDFSAPVLAGLQELCRTRRQTLFTVLLASLETLLARSSGEGDIAVATVAHGRESVDLENTFGYLAQVLPLRVSLEGHPSFDEVVSRTADSVAGALAHQAFPYVELARRLDFGRRSDDSPLLQVLFVLQQTARSGPAAWTSLALELPGETIAFGAATAEIVPLTPALPPFPLSIFAATAGGRLTVSLEFDRRWMQQEDAARLAARWQVVLEGAVASPASPISELPVLTPKEQEGLVDWNRTQREYGTNLCLHEWIARQVAATPDRTALECGSRRLTYRQLEQAADWNAHQLARRGVGPESVVGVYGHRSFEMVIALLACLKAGGAYTPLDPDYPAQRLAYSIRQSGVRIAFFIGDRAPVTEDVEVEWIRVSVDGAEETGPTVAVLPLNPAYAIFTSGSTGRPKGAVNTHEAIVNRLLWMQEAFPLGPDDVVLQKTPYSFDVSVWEFFWPLMTGARLAIAAPGEHGNSDYLIEAIRTHNVTTIHFVPSMMRAFLEHPKAGSCASLRRVICSGEALPPDLVDRFFSVLNCELHNLYGPTEAAVDVTWWPCSRGDASVPIGRPIANTETHVLDSSMAPVPVGSIGELYLGGCGLARGYCHAPGLTADRFVPNSRSGAAGSRLYRTGDLARFRDDGAIEYVGRSDNQVKIRGRRIEMGEIETVLSAHAGVLEAVCTIQKTPAGDDCIAAHVTRRPGPEVSAPELVRHASQRLPSWMLPAVIGFAESLPRTLTGKLDRKALPALRIGVEEADLELPRGETEIILAGIWTELLGIQRIGRATSFFDAGGHSLLATRLVAAIGHRFGVDFSIQLVFGNVNTIASMAETIEDLIIQSADPAEIDAALREIDGEAAPEIGSSVGEEIAR